MTDQTEPGESSAADAGDRRGKLRRLGALLLAVAALGVLFGLAPRDRVTAGDIGVAMLADSVNQKSADSAPKQTVVNGWTARDLLELIAKQGESPDQRPAALLTIGVLGLCLGLATSATKERASGMPGHVTSGHQPLSSTSDNRSLT